MASVTDNSPSELLTTSATPFDDETCWIEKLPFEILEKIFNYLTDVEQVRCEFVCKQWFNIFQSFWAENDGFRFKSYFFPDATILRKDKIVKTFSARSLSSLSALNNENIFKWCIRQGGSNFINVEMENVVFKNTIPFVYMLENCPKMKSLSLDNVSFEDSPMESMLTVLLSKESLTHLFINECRYHQDFSVDKMFPDSLQSNLTHLLLKNFAVVSSDFPRLCKFIAPKLKSFCFKWSSIDLESLINGLQYLNNVENLNMESRLWGSRCFLLLDGTLRDLAGCLNSLKVLNLRHQSQITSEGINYLLQSPFGRDKLTHLNVEFCSFINDLIFDGLKDRAADSPMLTISGFGSNITPDLVKRSNETCRWNIVIDKECEEDIFFGEEKKEIPEIDDDPDFEFGYDSDGDHRYHNDDYDGDDLYDHDDYDDDEDYDVDDDDDEDGMY